MPELPEVECVRRSLEPRLAGAVVASVRLRRGDVLTLPPGQPRAPRETLLLAGGRIARLSRHGKQLAIFTHDGRVCLVQLGMTGVLRWSSAPLARGSLTHVHCVWTLESSRGFFWFVDPRRFGGLTSLREESLAAHWAGLGPDALTISGSHLHKALARSRRPIKAALLDQHALAGVGNIYADEALFLARLLPHTPCRSLSAATWDRLAQAIRTVLAEAVLAGGSTLRDYRDGNGNPGLYQTRHSVYGRAGLPCPACGLILSGGLLAQRATVWCPACQR